MSDEGILRAMNKMADWNVELKAELFKASWERSILFAVIELMADDTPDAKFQAAIAIASMSQSEGQLSEEEIEEARRFAKLARNLRAMP